MKRYRIISTGLLQTSTSELIVKQKLEELAQKGILLARVLVDAFEDDFPIRILNAEQTRNPCRVQFTNM